MVRSEREARAKGLAELRAVWRKARGLFWAVALFSLAVNVLTLAGPLYMLNIYDRVLTSRSVETLIALTVIVGFLYGGLALLDLLRGRVMARVGAAFQDRLEARVFDAVLQAQASERTRPDALGGLRDLEAVQRMITSPARMAMFDLPFLPVYFAGIFVFHPLLGWLSLAGAGVLIGLAAGNQILSAGPVARANEAAQGAELFGHQIRTSADIVRALGMRQALFDRWLVRRSEALTATIRATDLGGGASALTKAVRQFLQSAMLGLGALLVLRGEMSAGAMIAGSILLGRGLAPVEVMLGHWTVLQRGRDGWLSLTRLLGSFPEESPRTALPRPRALIEVQNLTLLPPGEALAALRGVSFRVEPGHAVGVIGPSGAGKSSLAKALTGVWRPAGGKIRLDGAALDQFAPDTLGALVGYLPQQVSLFDGTIRDNIARMATAPDDAEVVLAARQAGAHDMILSLPQGYDTVVSVGGGRLSGGQVQRIGLARALYGSPVLIVLDEPNSNLDNDGSAALNAAIRAMKSAGQCVLIMAHRPAAIQECDLVLMLDGGAVRSFGPKEGVLREIVRNHQEIRQTTGLGGVA